MRQLPFQEIEHTHKEALLHRHRHTVKKEEEKKNLRGMKRDSGEHVTAPRLQLSTYCSRVSPSPGRETRHVFLISHMSFFFLSNLMACLVVRADNIYRRS